ncbi:hypothetical protein LuPra_02839 [Luteitalea pratensis]|uniref:Outer membrane protein beta-barrel domain-containing protein n=1 Tax=Luteitalea pratensis TaxID=1855912 RepID=A0A143PP80_LUTPR|nr:hypothetical protein [Luteitalea pratensis]AMY09619.1 hypothetical protein LuPra_02839 [Luteitalea pratensis]
MKVRRILESAGAASALLLLMSAPAAAQYPPNQSDPATGEKYNVEVAFGLWNPTPEIVFSSEQFGITGSEISLSNDLDVLQKTFRDFRLVLRPARKHKFRVEYIPIKYDIDSLLTRSVVFNGIVYSVGLPVQGEFKWDAWRFGYEYDFIYRDRGFLGVIAEAKYTHVSAELSAVGINEFSEAKAPIPAIGLVGRGYLMPNLAVTGEFTAFRLPDNEDRDYGGRYYDFDIYSTLNFSNNFGVTGGYRRLTLGYQAENDFGDFQMKGFYVMGVARF